MTISDFKKAMRQDGNFRSSENKLTYAMNAIEAELSYGRLTATQAGKLEEWANELFTDERPCLARSLGSPK